MQKSSLLKLATTAAAFALFPFTTLAPTPVAQAAWCTSQSTSQVGNPKANATADVLGSFAGSSFGGSSLSPAQADAVKQATSTGVAKQLITAVGPTRSMHFLTGPSSPDRTDRKWGITSTDLGIAYLDDSEENTPRMYLAFGDTFSCSGSGDGWRSNVLLRTRDFNYGDGVSVHQALTSDGWQSSGTAREFISSEKNPGVEHTTIPTAGIEINGTHYVDYMSVKEWPEKKPWVTNYAATMKSTDDGRTWSVVGDSTRVNEHATHDIILPGRKGYDTGNEKLQMSAFLQTPDKDGYVYRYSTPNGREGTAYLSRAKESEFPSESAFEYWNGSDWSDDRRDLEPVFGPSNPGKLGEMSVVYNEYINKYVALYFDSAKYALVMRTADTPEGKWSAPRELISGNDVPELYGGFILPKLDDQNLYYVLSTWGDYNTYVMRTDLDYAVNNPSADISVKVVGDVVAEGK